jgi:F-box-like
MVLSSPIFTLPDDILSEILTLNANRSRHSFLSCLAASHVCSHWRSICLNRPEIWRRFVFLEWKSNATPEDFQTLLARCKEVPIDVGWYSEEGEAGVPLENFQLRLQQLNKMRSFTLRLPLLSHSEAGSHALATRAAPLLQEFAVQGQLFTTAPGDLPSSFLQGTSHLQILDMDEMWLSGIEELSLPSLTRLTISSPLYCLDEAEAGERFGQILLLLSRSPNIRRLALKAYAPFSFDLPTAAATVLSSKPILLSNLEDVVLILSSSGWDIISRYFSLPPREQPLSVRFHSVRTRPHHQVTQHSPVPSWMSLLRSRIPTSLDTSLLSVFHIILNEGYLVGRYDMGANSCITTAVRHNGESPRPTACEDMFDMWAPAMPYFKTIGPSFSFPLGEVEPTYANLTRRLLAKATAATHLSNPDDTSLDFLTTNLYLKADTGELPILPALTTLVVAPPKTGEVDTGRLVDFVRARHSIGRPVSVFAKGRSMDGVEIPIVI